jgi:two-component system cell cycle sensor histidine kinase/response regulator CckA
VPALPTVASASYGLDASERLLTAIFESTRDAIIIADDDGRYVAVNQAAVDLYGLSREELIGKTVAELTPQLFAAADVWAAFLADGSAAGEIIVARPDGTVRYADYRATAHIQPGRHLSVLRDFTERRNAENAVAASERRFRLLVESSADVVYITDPRRFAYVSPAMTAMLGHAPADLIGRATLDFVHPDDVPVVQAALAGVLRDPRQVGHAKLRARHADGTYRVVELVGRNLLDEPTVNGIVVHLHDVTERERTQQELARTTASLSRSQATLEAAQAVAHVGSWTWELDGEKPVGTWSAETFRIFGVKPGGFEGNRETVRKLVHPDDLAFYDAAAHASLYDGAPYSVRYRVVRSDGTQRWVQSDGIVAPREEGRPARVIGTVLDITEAKEAEEELLQRERQLRGIFDGAIDAMFILDDDARLVDVNLAGLRLLGLPRTDVIGTKAHDHFPLGSEAPLHWKHFLASGVVSREIVRGNGEGERHLLLRGKANVFAGGHLAVMQELTEQKRAEKAVVDSERRFRLLVESSSDVVCITRDRRFTYVSPAVQNVLGHSPESMIGMDSLELVHPDDRAELGALREEFYGARPLSNAAFRPRMRHRDGTYRLVQSTARDFTTEPTIGGFVLNFHDITEREHALDELRRSEATLRESQATLEKAQAIGHTGSWTIEGWGPSAVVHASAETLRIHGLDPQAFDGDPRVFMAAFDPADWERSGAAISAATASGGTFAYDARIKRPDGEHRWVHIEGIIEASSDEQPVRIVGTTVDITPQRRAEGELRASEARYRRIIETTSEGIWVVDATNKTTFVNRRMAEMLDYRADEMIGESVKAFILGPPSEVDERFRRRRDGASEQVEVCYRKKDGTELWAVLATTPLFDAAGIYEGALAMVTDISSRREADATRAQLAAIVKSSNDAIFSKGLDGTILSWNEAAERLYGYTRAEAIGQPASMLTAPGFRDEVFEILARVARGEVVEQLDTMIRRKDDSLVDVSLTVSPTRSASGEIVGASAIARDVTERRRAERAEKSLRETEEQLRQAQKLEALGQLAGGVAHDFNNILSVILGYTSIMIEELAGGDPMRDDVTEIHEAGLRASELTRQLLAFSRKQVLQPRVIAVASVVARAQKMLRRLLGEDIELVLVDTLESTAVKADPGQLEQVIMNLAVNARDAMQSGGRLLVETGRVALSDDEAQRMAVAAGTYVTLTVSDSGAGMDEAVLARVFEPFFTTKEKGKGTGLGLSTVFGIVTQSAGHVSVTSEAGKGTTFRILLPATDATPDGAETRGQVIAATPGPRPSEVILLVEDEAQVRTLACSILRRAGYRVLDAANAGEALLICEQHAGTIDILVTDVVMPRMGGHPLALRLREQRAGLRVLYVSGYTDDTVLHHGVELGQLAFLAKPFTPQSLTAKVREVLDAPAPV